MNETQRKRRWLLHLALACAFAASFACALDGGGRVPPQGWAKRFGPVVPHDTFPKDCTLCHEGTGWREIRSDVPFDHAKETGYALEGAHAEAQCLRCHNDRGSAKAFAARGCAGCHPDVHRGNLGLACKDCHASQDWRPVGQIAQHARTRFPLVGAHLATACFACHPNAAVGQFQGAEPVCSLCHSNDYAATTNPNHAAANFATTCEDCHGMTSWKPAKFNHSGITAACVTCHLSDYQGTTNPNHMGLGFPQTCQQCHNTKSWKPANFNHAGITSNCAQCHLSDYQATTDPNHTAAGFPAVCETCHKSTTTWNGATFTHAFPITSGKHKNFACGSCHLVPTNFATYSCIHCHQHDQPTMANKHQRVGGYAWNSVLCVTCHPQGKA